MPLGFSSRNPGVLFASVLVLALVFLLYPSSAQAIPSIEVRAGYVSGTVLSQVPIDITLINRYDSVEAFTVWLKLSRPDIAKFHTVLTGGVYKGTFDTTSGMVCKGFEFLDVRSTVGDGLDLLITGIANANGGPPAVKAPIPPGASSRTMLRLYLDIQNIPDTSTDRTATVSIEKNFLEKYIFSRPDGSAIGIYNQVVPDTICYQCLQWLNGVCVNKVKKTLPPCDLTEIVQDTIAVLDTTVVKAYDGSVTILAGCCTGTTGNVNMSGIVDAADLSALVSYLTGGGFVLPCAKEANINALGIVDSADLAALVSYLTGGGFVLPACP